MRTIIQLVFKVCNNDKTHESSQVSVHYTLFDGLSQSH